MKTLTAILFGTIKFAYWMLCPAMAVVMMATDDDEQEDEDELADVTE